MPAPTRAARKPTTRTTTAATSKLRPTACAHSSKAMSHHLVPPLWGLLDPMSPPAREEGPTSSVAGEADADGAGHRALHNPPGRSRSRRGRSRSGQIKEETMTVGPVQLLVLGFSHPQFRGEILEELDRLRQSDEVRVIDALAVYKDSKGDIEVEHLSNLTRDEAIELGSKIGALIGLGIDGEAGMEAGAVAGAEAAAEGAEFFTDEDAWDVLEDIPNDSAAALLLLEHHW